MRDPMVQHAFLMQHAPRADAIREGESLEVWQARARTTLAQLLGLPFERCDEQFRIESQRDTDTYTEYRLAFHTEAHFELIACLRVPLHAPAGMPVVICLQGHSKGMHISLGEPRYEGDEQTIHGGDRDFARQIIQKGFAALALEQRAFGECGGTPEGPNCYQPAASAMLLGRTLIGERVWDISRAIDMLEAHFPQLDTRRIAVMGNSGGGTAAIYAAAMDTRIAAAMPSCALCGFMPSIGMQRHCLCNYIPNVLNHFDMGDLAGLIAPRPLVVVNGQHDTIFPIDSAREQVAIARTYYARVQAEDRCRHVVGPEGHRFYAALGWPVFDEITGW
jgi:hypothetical protein